MTLSAPADYTALPAALAAQGVTALDVVIANAGAASGWHAVLGTTPEDAAADMDVNAAGPLRLFQAAWPLLQARGPGAKIVFMGSSLGSIGGLEQESLTGVGYGMAKAAVHYLAKKIAVDFKAEGLVVGILHPG